MLSLSDCQIGIVMQIASVVPIERRSIFLERVGAMLNVRRTFTDDDVADVAQLALVGLVHQHSAA
jgi:hypothetical protein